MSTWEPYLEWNIMVQICKYDLASNTALTSFKIWLLPNPFVGTVQSVGRNSSLSSCKLTAWRATSILGGRFESSRCKASMVLKTDPTVSHTATHLNKSRVVKAFLRGRWVTIEKKYSPNSGGPCNGRSYSIDEILPNVEKPSKRFGFQKPNFVLPEKYKLHTTFTNFLHTINSESFLAV